MIEFLLILTWTGSAFLTSFVAGEKNYSSTAWFFIGLIFGVVGLIAAAGLPTKEGLIRSSKDSLKFCQKCGKGTDYNFGEAYEHICRECAVKEETNI